MCNLSIVFVFMNAESDQISAWGSNIVLFSTVPKLLALLCAWNAVIFRPYSPSFWPSGITSFLVILLYWSRHVIFHASRATDLCIPLIEGRVSESQKGTDSTVDDYTRPLLDLRSTCRHHRRPKSANTVRGFKKPVLISKRLVNRLAGDTGTCVSELWTVMIT